MNRFSVKIFGDSFCVVDSQGRMATRYGLDRQTADNLAYLLNLSSEEAQATRERYARYTSNTIDGELEPLQPAPTIPEGHSKLSGFSMYGRRPLKEGSPAYTLRECAIVLFWVGVVIGLAYLFTMRGPV